MFGFILSFVLAICTWALFLPNLSPSLPTLPIWILFFGLVGIMISFMIEESKEMAISLSGLTAVLGFLYLIIGLLISSSMFSAGEYRGIIGDVKVSESTSTGKLEVVTDPKYIRTVDIETARNVMDKKLGEIQALGSQYMVGDPDIQKVGNGLYWVAPLEYRGLFKWSSSSGIPAYVKVSASDQSDVTLVTEYGSGSKVSMRYSPSSYFGDWLDRHVFFSGFATKPKEYPAFEIDDTGKPYWVISTYDTKVGFSGNDVDGAIIVDPESGKMEWKSIKDMPSWVDRVQPESFIATQVDDWGVFVHGWWNPSNKDTLRITSNDLRLTYGTDGRSYWYAGLANGNMKDSSLNGFMLVDTVTKEATFHKESGASESAAQMSAEGKLQQMGYVASNPVLYSVGGVPTYVMAMKDKSGIMKQVAFVSVKDFTVVGVGDNSASAYRNYRDELTKNKTSTAPGPEDLLEKVSGKVVRVSSYVSGGNTYVLFEIDSKSFSISAAVYPYSVMLRDGDTVQVEYSKNDSEKGFFRVSSLERDILKSK